MQQRSAAKASQAEQISRTGCRVGRQQHQARSRLWASHIPPCNKATEALDGFWYAHHRSGMRELLCWALQCWCHPVEEGATAVLLPGLLVA